MDELTKGTWVVNSVKHLVGLKTNTPELAYFEATELSGKAGMLLSRLVADEQEVVPAPKLRVLARESGITHGEIHACLDNLRRLEKIDFTLDENGKPKDVEVYCFSASDALTSTSKLFDSLGPSAHEEANLVSLNDTFRLPRFESELIEVVTEEGFSEEIANQTLRLQDSLGLVKSSTESQKKLYYNEYAFAGDPLKIANAVKGLDGQDRVLVQDVLDLVGDSPGYSIEALKTKFPAHILKLLEGVGLIDALTVHSPIGDATFATLPQMRGITIDLPVLSIDVFHRAKVLLSCLRFGEIKSSAGRGRIDSTEKLINIVNKLVRGEWVGPCTAIGQDYQLLEKDGVIVTRPGFPGTYSMKLRQKEVGLLIKQILEFKRAVPEMDSELQRLLEKQPSGYTIPEDRRTQILARPTKGVAELREKLLHSLRTGLR
ncbi:MAG TPA: hypothetical protein VGC73_05280 [Pyrinomonadaceae bacterium]|jgi:hypothetical protein